MANQKLSALTSIPAVDRAADLLYVVDTSAGTSNKVTPNGLLGISGAPVGDTDTATLTNKTLTAPTISSPVLSGTITGTYTIGGTPTFPATVLTTTNSVTVSGKTLTSPTINTATIVNPTLTTDTISEYTSTNGVTVDGLNIKDGALNTANSVPNSAIATGVQSSKLSNPYKFLGYRNAALALTNGAWNLVACDAELFDTGSNFDITTNKGRFTAPVNGFYQFNGSAGVTNLPNNTLGSISLYKNGTQFITGFQGYTGGTTTTTILQVATMVQLVAGDYIELWIYNGGTGLSLAIGSNQEFNQFSGFLVSAT